MMNRTSRNSFRASDTKVDLKMRSVSLPPVVLSNLTAHFMAGTSIVGPAVKRNQKRYVHPDR